MADVAPISPEQQEEEEFEFRARAEEEARARMTAAQTSEAKNPEPGITGNLVGAAQTAWQLAQEHPVAASALGYGAYNLASKVPVVGPAISTGIEKVAETTIPKYKVGKALVQGASDWASKFGAQQAAGAAAAQDAQALAQLQHQIRMLQSSGQPVPQNLMNAYNTVAQRVGGAVPTPTAPVAPQMPAQAANAARGAAAAEGAGAGNWMTQALNMAKQYGPAMARIGGTAAAALTPGNIGQNYNVPQTGRMRGMEINPLTGRPWTPEQIAQYEANTALFDQQLGAPQFRR